MNDEIQKLLKTSRKEYYTAYPLPERVFEPLYDALEKLAESHAILEARISAPRVEDGELLLVWNYYNPDDKIKRHACGTVDEYGFIEVYDKGDGSVDSGISSFNQFNLVNGN